jgi:hypothetical protein
MAYEDPKRIDINEPESNDGTFRALLRMRVRAGDQPLKDNLENSAANAQYISPAIQNELLDAAGQLIKQSIIKDVKKAKV